MNFEWRTVESRYSTGEILFINGINVGSYFWAAGSDSRDEKKPPYAIGTRLPGFILNGRYETQEEAKAALEGFVNRWIKKITEKPAAGEEIEE